MVVRIRLSRFGGRYNPSYYINVANSFNKRDGKYIERLGHYCAIPDKRGVKTVNLNFQRTKYWLSVGAQPTDTVAGLLSKAGLYPKKPFHHVKATSDINKTDSDKDHKEEEQTDNVNKCN